MSDWGREVKLLILNTDYTRYLRSLYLRNSGLNTKSYAEQMAVRNQGLFGVADYYSRNLRALGHDAQEIHVNNPWLQYAWALENRLSVTAPEAPREEGEERPASGQPPKGVTLLKTLLRPVVRRLGISRSPLSVWEAVVLKAQIERINPDVILNHDPSYVGSDFLSRVKRRGRTIVGQIASPLPRYETYSAYDFMMSSLPNFVENFRARGIRSELSHLAFEPSILNALGPQPERDIAVSFVGSLSAEHSARIFFLEYLAERVPLKVWGPSVERLPAESPLWRCYQGEAWGIEMYQILRRSVVTLNRHIDLSEDFANNMRLYEGTGMGALLLTDQKKNLHELFQPGKHLVTYDSNEACVDEIRNLLEDRSRCDAMAFAGQAHVLRCHNYLVRMQEFLNILERYRHPRGDTRSLD